MSRMDQERNRFGSNLAEVEKESLKKVLAYSEDFMQLQREEPDYQGITENLLEICGGKFAAFNLYDEERKSFTTMAIAGNQKMIQLGLKLVGLCNGKMKWDHDDMREQKMKGQTTTRFSSVAELSGGVLPKSLVEKATERLDIGEAAVIKILSGEKILGDFTVFMSEGKTLEQQEIAEIFSNQVGLVIERQRMEKQLSDQNNLLTKLSQQVPGTLFQARLSPEGVFEFIYISDGVQDVCEVSPKEVMENPDVVFSHIHPDDYRRVMQSIETSATELSIWEVEYRVVLPTKGERWVRGFARPERLSDGSISWNAYLNDFTDQVRRQQKIEYLSMHDDLTGLFNRRFMEQEEGRLDREENLPLAYFYIDVNALKLNNDAFGHEKGDQLLKLVAKSLQKTCRARDVIARVGGDEFSILLPRTTKDQAALIADRINKEIARVKLDPLMVSIAMGYGVKNSIQEQLENIKSIAEKRMYKNKRKQGSAMRSETIGMILQSIEEKHQKEEIHSLRVGEYSGRIAEALGLEGRELEKIKQGAYLHDIGKVMVAPEILNKPAELTEEEREMVQQHGEIGYQILKSLEEYQELAEMVLYHHERWDGEGYPQGLKHQEIPLGARIICVADAYEAMTAHRPYRETRSKEAAIEELRRCAGSQFDPELVQIFIREITDLPE